MHLLKKKRWLLAIAAVIAVGLIGWVVLPPEEPSSPESSPDIEEKEPEPASSRVIGRSVEGRDIEVYTFGSGDTHLLFVGGIHGGYEWNSVLLAYRFIDHLKADPAAVPEGLRISIIPSANPDGLFEVIGQAGRFTLEDVPADEGEPPTGRFNANEVDLNRNFDCQWQPESTWRGQSVSAGDEPFSEPEAQAIRDLVEADRPDAAVFWHSQSNAVYASECEDGILPETLEVMNTYAEAAGYPSVESFDHYPITGDAEGWLASLDIPAVTVELSTHETVEWEKNLAGFQAVVEMYSEELAEE